MTKAERTVLWDAIEMTFDRGPVNDLGDELKNTIEQNLVTASYSVPELRQACCTFLKMDFKELATKARELDPELTL